MDSDDIVDDVNALLKLGVGDSYRLEHIKQAYVQNKSLWVTDENYLKRLREKYLIKYNTDVQTNTDEHFENEFEGKGTIHCWKCGKKGPLGANFCMICGTSLFEIGTTQTTPESVNSKTPKKPISLKIPILVGIPVLVLIILGVGYTQGIFDTVLESSIMSDTVESTQDLEDELPCETDSICGCGTIYDPDTNLCILDPQK